MEKRQKIQPVILRPRKPWGKVSRPQQAVDRRMLQGGREKPLERDEEHMQESPVFFPQKQKLGKSSAGGLSFSDPPKARPQYSSQSPQSDKSPPLLGWRAGAVFYLYGAFHGLMAHIPQSLQPSGTPVHTRRPWNYLCSTHLCSVGPSFPTFQLFYNIPRFYQTCP